MVKYLPLLVSLSLLDCIDEVALKHNIPRKVLTNIVVSEGKPIMDSDTLCNKVQIIGSVLGDYQKQGLTIKQSVYKYGLDPNKIVGIDHE
jgi:hypothetical protein